MMMALTVLVVALASPAAAQEITKLSHVRYSYPTWARDSILYESPTAGSWDIWIMPATGMDAAGRGARRITPSASLDRTPHLSPDGRSVVFISDRAGNYDVWRMPVDGGDPERLTDTDEAEIHPYWTPDGRRIVFNRRVAGEPTYSIWIMDADGSDQRELLRDSDLNSYAQMSPDGRLLVFDKWWENDENNGEIMLLDLATGSLTRLTDNDGYDGYPTWYPDSRHVLYSGQIDGRFKLIRIDVITGEQVQLTDGEGDDQRADVSPDGSMVVFNRNLGGSIEIYAMPVATPTRRP